MKQGYTWSDQPLICINQKTKVIISIRDDANQTNLFLADYKVPKTDPVLSNHGLDKTIVIGNNAQTKAVFN